MIFLLYYSVIIKQNDPLFMIYLHLIQLALFCFFMAFVGKLFINLLIDKQ